MKKVYLLMALALHLGLISSCSDSDNSTIATQVEGTDTEVEGDGDVYEEDFSDTDFEASDWTELTHSNSADPDFDEVFEDNTVKRIDLVITEEPLARHAR